MIGSSNMFTRQKIINLMYLLFIAMLAINIDRDILVSFEKINNSLEQTSELIYENNKVSYNKLQEVDKRNELIKLINVSNNLFDYIEQIKKKLKNNKIFGITVSNMSDTDKVKDVFFNNKYGIELVNNIQLFKNYLSILYKNDSLNQVRINYIFDTSTKINNLSWLYYNFHEQPVIAAICNLSKLQLDVRREESKAIDYIKSGNLKSLDNHNFKALFYAPQLIEINKKVNIDVVLGSYGNGINGIVKTNIGNAKLINGKATLNLIPTKVGEYKLTGKVYYNSSVNTKDNFNKIVIIDESQYKVINKVDNNKELNKSSKIIKDNNINENFRKGHLGAIIPDNLLIVYRGVINPISVIVDGAKTPLNLTCSIGKLVKIGTNKWNYTVSGEIGSQVIFTVYTKDYQGKNIVFKKNFRIKNIPPARGVILGKTSPIIPNESIINQKIRVDWPDFLFPITAKVTSFKVKIQGYPTFNVVGDDMIKLNSLIGKVKRGDIMGIFNIKYLTNTGVSGEASSISVQVQ